MNSFELFDRTVGGDDLLLGSRGEDTLFGDGFALHGQASGGRDMLIGGGGDDALFGDGFLLEAGARGGDDVLDGGQGSDVLFGDAAERHPLARGGSDIFCFAPGSGHDVIGDFDDAVGGPQDLIDLTGWSEITGFADLDGHLDGNLLSLGRVGGTQETANTVLVQFSGDVEFLDAEDFLFA